MDFEEIKSKWSWSPIRNCPGRYVWKEANKTISPAEVVGSEVILNEFRIENANDVIVVVQINDGGLISYRKEDQTYLHTLNTMEGFERKLQQLGISL